MLTGYTGVRTDKKIAVDLSQVYSFLMKTDMSWSKAMEVK